MSHVLFIFQFSYEMKFGFFVLFCLSVNNGPLTFQESFFKPTQVLRSACSLRRPVVHAKQLSPMKLKRSTGSHGPVFWVKTARESGHHTQT